MKVKIIEAMSTKEVEEKINAFLKDFTAEQIIDIQLAAGYGSTLALIRYQA